MGTDLDETMRPALHIVVRLLGKIVTTIA